MKKNHIISLICGVFAAVLCLSSCSTIKKTKELKVTSAHITNISPNGLKGINLTLHIGLDNPGVQITLSDILCEVKDYGKVLGIVEVDPLTIRRKSRDVHEITTHLKLADGIMLYDLGKFLDISSLEQLTVDLRAKVKLKSGIYKNLEYKDIPLKKLLEAAQK